MSDPKGTLRSLLASSGVQNDGKVTELIEGVSDEQCGLLIDILSSKSGKARRNTEDGDGGSLTGLREIYEALELDDSLELPDEPRYMERELKEQHISNFVETSKNSNEKIANGLRQILKARSERMASELRKWSYELSDPDFPIAIDQQIKDAKILSTEESEAIRTKLDEAQERIAQAMKNHKDVK